MHPSQRQKTLKFCVVTVCILFIVRQIWNEISLLSRAGGMFSGIGHVLRELVSSSWLLVVFIDFIGGSLFAAVYIYLRHGLPLLGLPIGGVVVLCVLLGSFLPLLYLAVLLLGESSLEAIVPGISPHHAEEEQEKWLKPRAIGGFFFAYLILTAILVVIAWSRESFRHAWSVMFRNVYARTLTEAYFQGVLVTALLLVMLSGGNTFSALFWFIAAIVFGNIAACAYVCLTAWKAAREGSSFRKVLFTAANVVPSDGVSLTNPGQMYTSI